MTKAVWQQLNWAQRSQVEALLHTRIQQPFLRKAIVEFEEGIVDTLGANVWRPVRNKALLQPERMWLTILGFND